VTVGVLLGLSSDCFDDSAIAVSYVHRHRSARRVDVAIAFGVVEVDAFGAFEDRFESVIGEHMLPVAFDAALGWDSFFRCRHGSLLCGWRYQFRQSSFLK